MAFEWFGYVGMAMILFAFIMNQMHYWKDDFLIYDVFNAVGGALMVVYAIMISSIPFAILNGAWTAVSVRDIILDVRRSKVHVGHKKR